MYIPNDMKNIQIIDGAENCVYDIFSVTNEEFNLIFPEGTDIAFIEDVYANGDHDLLDVAFENIRKRRIRKPNAQGIHGTIFFGLEQKKMYYPTRRDEEASNPDGSKLRA